MAKYQYLLVLAFIGACAIFITTVFRIRVRKFWYLFLLTDFVILTIYLIWDYWAISKKTWYFDGQQILGIKIFEIIPIEEILFFVLVPLTSLLTYLALKKLLKWKITPR